MKRITTYFDYKSPYAYLAQADTLALAEREGVELDLLPYTLDIPAYLGRAEVNERKEVVRSERNAHQWRRVIYSYMDCRREANRRGIVLRGTRKIFDSTIAHIAYLFARGHDNIFVFHMQVYEKFWRRELDIEDPLVMTAALEAAGIPGDGFRDYLDRDGPRDLQRMQKAAEDEGVFGVPSYFIEGQHYWGYERLPRVIEHLDSD